MKIASDGQKRSPHNTGEHPYYDESNTHYHESRHPPKPIAATFGNSPSKVRIVNQNQSTLRLLPMHPLWKPQMTAHLEYYWRYQLACNIGLIDSVPIQ